MYKDFFESFEFSKENIERYLRNAIRDITIASESECVEVIFKFCYDAIIKIGVAFAALQGFRLKSRTGHYIALLDFLQANLGIIWKPKLLVCEAMRRKRNTDLYGEGILIGQSETKEFLSIVIDLSEELNKRYKERFLKQRKLL